MARIHVVYKEYFVGGFLIFATLALLTLIFATLVKNNLFVDQYQLHTVFQDKSDMNVGAKVKISGITVGQVSEISFNSENKIEVVMQIKISYQYLIRNNSVATIIQERFPISDRIIAISPGTKDYPMLEDGMTVNAKEMLSLDIILQQTLNAFSDLTVIIDKIKKGEGTLGALVQKDDLYRQLDAVVAEALPLLRHGNKLIAQLNDITGKVNGVMDSVPAVMTTAEGTLGQVGSFLASANGLIDSLNVITGKISALLDKMPVVVNQGQGLMQNTNDLMNGVKKIWPISSKIKQESEDPPIFIDKE
ncbi:MAG: hypothetical protein A2268_03155 [Candidatus Raymondbacteria bacterium RifOxyA12_full_50_37]|uniref:Mce/MlaD domain-containing protein n=1 Tax=Candidatus Raymondbacteria bacterium RIFOXYD12_FULL_49_13 TaxID=1817890 RepID=A0A1F7F834_UNCRA|nr:MAG: hypothetical protein A2268_03155 [Candidatus Raymondbacteria bacterium RifOxyA12_full_50_37]OGJ86738.1 MAG: hypothetical protein A2248_09885 [Candidatus Raymondbacteria bacterium RIFOXYA2_FULL_49_16]OGK01544.1 MAG: hypothetical protein A2350_06420 [Candidatus Raymondbacteria bacterium RifOxyB12_full_50_8]OGK02830.1 MAG: hypothetical protein A2519_06595 [Candidatus Raymondbacteria bacterium RIFOXYD12_FULL_49_13]OGP40914.1 MAG: hypothetical protein A2324_13315 [Candidatus Raymondbacteria 